MAAATWAIPLTTSQSSELISQFGFVMRGWLSVGPVARRNAEPGDPVDLQATICAMKQDLL